ncbi:MAG: putative serine/threonine-protein kinase Nek3, partial [Streblomastix strix]
MSRQEDDPQAHPSYNNYEEVKELSKGAWGRLILVQYQKTKKFFKMLRLPYLSIANKKLADDDVAILKFKSKYLVAFIEAFQYQNDLCIITEHCPYGNIREFIEELKLVPDKERKTQVYEILFQILSGVLDLHSQGILHEDLKPENVFLDINGNIKIGNYGINFVLSLESKAVGKKSYQPPEAYKKEKYTFASDIFSAGVIVLESLIGKNPFEGATIEETVNNIINGTIQPLPDYISSNLRDTLLSMLNKDPSKRPTAKELL